MVGNYDINLMPDFVQRHIMEQTLIRSIKRHMAHEVTYVERVLIYLNDTNFSVFHSVSLLSIRKEQKQTTLLCKATKYVCSSVKIQ